METKNISRWINAVLVIAFMFAGWGCGIADPNSSAVHATKSIGSYVYRAEQDVAMYEEILKKQLENRRILKQNIENMTVWDKIKRTASNLDAVRRFEGEDVVPLSAEQDSLEHMDRKILETRRNLEYTKNKLKDLKRAEGGGEGGGGGC